MSAESKRNKKKTQSQTEPEGSISEKNNKKTSRCGFEEDEEQEEEA